MGTYDRCLDSIAPDEKFMLMVGDIVLVDITVSQLEYIDAVHRVYSTEPIPGEHLCLVLSCSACGDCVNLQFRGTKTGLSFPVPEKLISLEIGRHRETETITLASYGKTYIYVKPVSESCCM